MRTLSKKLFAPALMMAACITAGYAQNVSPNAPPAPASVLRPPIKTISRCGLLWQGTFSSATLGNADFTANGAATFETVSVTKDGEPAGNTQRAQRLDVNVQTDLGDISWHFSDARNTPTTITANQADADFPATSDIYFTPEATVSSQEGVIYRATSEVHLQTTNLNSFGPQLNESYTLASGPIDFEDVSTGEVVFTIDAQSINVGDPDSKLRPIIGSRSNCPVLWRGTLTSDKIGNTDFRATGTASFETQSVTPESEPAGNTQRASSLRASVATDLGTISWTFFPADDVTVTSINANQLDADFPATSDIYFIPEATISSQKDAKYRATSEVHLQTTNLNSFNPQVNETYSLVSGPIDFYDEATGEIAFTIDATEIVVGPSDNGGGDGGVAPDQRGLR